MPWRPRPARRQILGSWVVLPEPVSPATTTTWWSRMAAVISSTRSLIGRVGGNSMSIGMVSARIGGRRPRLPAVSPPAGPGGWSGEFPAAVEEVELVVDALGGGVRQRHRPDRAGVVHQHVHPLPAAGRGGDHR